MDYRKTYEEWIANPLFDAATKQELKAITDENEIKDRFYKGLEFGTGGLRGVIGAGTNRINIYTVAKATQGLANYILDKAGADGKRGVAIAYDSRHMSPKFAECAALVLNGNGIHAYVFPSLRPTPMLSYAVRKLGMTAGIMITASHNPKEYNGYKLYWEDGGQVTYPRDEEIIQYVNAVEDFACIKKLEKGMAVQQGLFHIISQDIDDSYMEEVLKQSLQPALIQQQGNNLSIVYTPLHGAGSLPVQKALKQAGFNNVYVVKSQEMPDPDFTTVPYPNPEDPQVFEEAMVLADKVDADVLLATDPDSDRIGVMVKNLEGAYITLNGNMTGAMLCAYILSQKKLKQTLPANAAVIKTIVSTAMVDQICSEYGATIQKVLTGFKYIGEKIKEFESSHAYEFVFGFEESYGVLAGTYTRDKDAVSAALLICEMAAFLKGQGQTVYEGLLALYEKYGYYQETVVPITLQGITGMEKIQAIMEFFRQNPPQILCSQTITTLKDYKASVQFDQIINSISEITLPKSNVLHYTLADGSWFCIRPSGTEPKIKIYVGVKGQSLTDADAKLKNYEKGLLEMIQPFL